MIKFTKMTGCGNDYVYINCFEEMVDNPNELSKRVSDRHFGIGSDGLVLICPSEVADCKMRMFNPDGSESEMCGNAIRCVGKYVHDRGVINKTTITVETLAGIKILELHLDEKGETQTLTVDMGEPILAPELVPVAAEGTPVTNLKLTALDKSWAFTCVSMGNPHAVAFIDTPVKDFEVEKYGPVLEVDSHFPRKANIEFVEKVDDSHLKMRVWERGTGETWACGTGTCATVVASNIVGACKRGPVAVELLGGTLTIDWNESNGHVYMTGPATFVFDGVLFD